MFKLGPMTSLCLLLGIGAQKPIAPVEMPVFGEPNTPVAFEIPEPSPVHPWSLFHRAWIEKDIDNDEDLNLMAEDVEGRIDPEFQVPAAIKPRVKFWMTVYAKYTSHTKIIHDRNHPELVYGYLDLSPLYRMKITPWRLERWSRQIEKHIQSRLAIYLTSAFTPALGPVERPADQAQFEEFLRAKGIKRNRLTMSLAKTIRSQLGQRDIFLLALARSEKLLPEFERVFEEAGLPRALARIPFVESSFHPGASSKVRAMGVWQIMPRTAKELIGQQNRKLWKNPQLQTYAAAELLRRNRSVLPDWGTTITSYNAGVGRISRLVKRYGIDDISELLQTPEMKKRLGFAGQNFYSEVLAAHYVEAYREVWFPQDEVDTFTELAAGNGDGNDQCGAEESERTELASMGW